MCDIDPSKLKVVELRAELQARGLDARGNKAVLVERLEAAINAEKEENETSEVEDAIRTNEETDVQNNNQELVEEAQDSVEGNSFPPEEAETLAESAEDGDVQVLEEDKHLSSVDASLPRSEKGDMSVKTELRQAFHQPAMKQEIKQEENETLLDQNASRGEKRKWPEGEVKTEPHVKEEPLDDRQETVVVLDSYNSDLNLMQSTDRCSAKPMTVEGFAFMWAGARATFGIRTGKICFEVKVLRHMDVPHLPEDEINPHVVRVGFSCDEVSLLLGEEALSWGYGGTGKASTNLKFKDYGVPFVEGDVVTSFLDMAPNRIDISFAKNGRHLGSAYNFPRSEIGEKALFPHVLSKNCEFEINFGQMESPMFPLPMTHQEYVFISCAPLQQRVRGTIAPKHTDECEMIMMCGLPGSGKTTWANKYCADHPEKKYNILGTNNIIDRMKVMGLPRKRNYAGRWEVLIQQSTKCLNKMMEVGSKLKRNFILDQTNVYPSAQRRKMRSFEGFARRAVVIVPTDEEFQQRIAKREREEGKDVPDSAVLEMKANFGLPVVGPLFDAIDYPELQREEAEELIKKYNEEGALAVGPPKRFFPNSSPQNRQGSGRWEPVDQSKGPMGGGDQRGPNPSHNRESFGGRRGGGAS